VLSLRGPLKGLVHRWRQAAAVHGERCEACGLSVAKCPERQSGSCTPDTWACGRHPTDHSTVAAMSRQLAGARAADLAGLRGPG